MQDTLGFDRETSQRWLRLVRGVLWPYFRPCVIGARNLPAGGALYRGISEEEALRWMLVLGTPDEVCRQIDRYIEAGVTHFVLTLSPYNFDVFERFAAEVLPRYRQAGAGGGAEDEVARHTREVSPC